MTTIAIQTSCHLGFPALSESRRGSLCRLLREIAWQQSKAEKIVWELLDNTSIKPEIRRQGKAWLRCYKRQSELVWLQFPEGRADREGKFDMHDQRENKQINRSLRKISDGLADNTGVDRKDMWEFIGGDYDEPVPPLRPLLARLSLLEMPA